jgi:hypothetical protein
VKVLVLYSLQVILAAAAAMAAINQLLSTVATTKNSCSQKKAIVSRMKTKPLLIKAIITTISTRDTRIYHEVWQTTKECLRIHC